MRILMMCWRPWCLLMMMMEIEAYWRCPDDACWWCSYRWWLWAIALYGGAHGPVDYLMIAWFAWWWSPCIWWRPWGHDGDDMMMPWWRWHDDDSLACALMTWHIMWWVACDEDILIPLLNTFIHLTYPCARPIYPCKPLPNPHTPFLNPNTSPNPSLSTTLPLYIHHRPTPILR